VQVTALGPVNVKGLAEPIELYEVTHAGTARSRFQVLASRGLTTFVGRAGEIEHLDTGLGQVRAGLGQVVAITGEPGAGKSRLLWQYIQAPSTLSFAKTSSASADDDPGNATRVWTGIWEAGQLAAGVRRAHQGKVGSVDGGTASGLNEGGREW
jgi:hypothetical protein